MFTLDKGLAQHLDKELAQYSYVMWDVLEMNRLFWTAVMMGLVVPTVHICMILELSVPQVSDMVTNSSHLIEVLFGTS